MTREGDATSGTGAATPVLESNTTHPHSETPEGTVSHRKSRVAAASLAVLGLYGDRCIS